MTIKEAATKWKISERRIRKLIKDGRVFGSIKLGTTWIIPNETAKPIDKRFVDEKIKFIIDLPSKYFDEIDDKLKILNSKRPLSKATINSLRENSFLDWTYNSNAIEGNTLTLRETQVVLEGITIGGKSLKEHLEVINHKEAIKYVEELVNAKSNISEWNIKNIHQLVIKEIDSTNAGVYRKENVKILGASHNPPDYIKVPEKMEKLINDFNSWHMFHPIVRSALLHGEFVKIHPFIDGNGRTARLIMNLEAMKYGYLPIIIKKETRLKYYEALDKASTNHDYTDFVKMLVEEEFKILTKYLNLL
jgi:Fic family protein